MTVRIEAHPEALDVFVTGADRLFGLRSRLELPMHRITHVRVVPAAEAKADLWLRTGGLGLPGIAAVGHFRGRTARRQWWRVYRGDEVVVIDLCPASQFDRVVLELDDPHAACASIRAQMGHREPPSR